MIYGRAIITDINESRQKLETNGAKLIEEFAFTDIIYINKTNRSLTDDTLKVRVYSKTEWYTKNVVLIRKQTEILKTGKVDNIILKIEFDSRNDAKGFIKEYLSAEFEYAVEFSKNGWEYELDSKRVWVEYINKFKPTIEVGAKSEDEIKDVYNLIGIVEELHKSVPETIYLQEKRLGNTRELMSF